MINAINNKISLNKLINLGINNYYKILTLKMKSKYKKTIGIEI